jgi:hypothetical protein
MVTISESGKLAGPWREHYAIYTKNGGHGMIFTSFEGKLHLALHQPNERGKERLHLFEVLDSENRLEIGKEINLY